MKHSLTVFLLSAIVLSSCRTSGLATRDQYLESIYWQENSMPDKALESFPKNEEGGFVTTLEKSWLNLLAKKFDPKPLLKVTLDLESRKTLFISREAAAFFYKETEDGYYPAEHEAILAHMIGAMHFLAKNQYSSARVEVQRAARYLQTQYGAGRRFDDPSLRLWLASLWAVLGDWNNARIDLKVAFQLDNTQKWIKDLIKLEKPPKHIYLGMLGAGADIKWHAKSDVNAIRGLKNLEFFSKSSPSQIKLSMGENTKKVIKVIPTERWYYRHQDRNQVIKDVIDNSVYSGQAAGVAVGAGTLYTTGIIAGIGVFGLGLGAGSAVAWHLIQAATSSDGVYGALLLGAGITYGGYKAGTAIYEEGKDSSYELLEHGLGQANNYRYVRFLPEYIFMDYTDKASEDTALLIVEKVDRKIEPFLTVSSKDNATQVHYFHHSGKKDPELKVDESIRHWYDGRLTWVFSSRPKLGDNEVCRKLGLEWSAPNSYELRKAVANGLMSEKKNQYIAKALKEVDRIWLDAVVEKEVVDGKTIKVTKCLSSSLLKAASIETSCLNLNIVACVKEGRID